jgi:hypothetical protein
MRSEAHFTFVLQLVESKQPIDFGSFKIKAAPYMRLTNPQQIEACRTLLKDVKLD